MITVVGISHKTAPLPVRERFALDADASVTLLQGLGSEALLLVTCNRTELYGTHPPEQLRGALLSASGVADAPLSTLTDDDAARHLLAVAAGLDSMVLGEPQILGQVREALATARTAGTLGAILDRLGRQAMAAGRRVRHETTLGGGRPSIPRLATGVAHDLLGGLHGRTLLVVGAGKVGGLTAAALRDAGAGSVIVTNRTQEKAEVLARETGGRSAAYGDLDRLLRQADIVLCCTGAREPILDAPRLRAALDERAGRPLLVIDIAVPRDVAPQARDLDGTRLVDLDDLRAFATSTVPRRVVEEAWAIVAEEAQGFSAWLAARRAVPAIQALRARADAILEAEVGGRDGPEAERMRRFGRRLLNRLLHHPLVQIRNGAAAHGADYLSVVMDLFALEERTPAEPEDED